MTSIETIDTTYGNTVAVPDAMPEDNPLTLIDQIKDFMEEGSQIDIFTGLLALQELMQETDDSDVRLQAGLLWEDYATFDDLDMILQFLANLQYHINELTWLQYDVLLYAKNSVSQNQLAAALGVSAATVSQRAKAAEWISPEARDHGMALSVAHAAINTKDSGISPLEAYEKAKDSSMSARQVSGMIEEMRPKKAKKMSVAGSGHLSWKGHKLEIVPDKFNDEDGFTLDEQMDVKFTVREA